MFIDLCDNTFIHICLCLVGNEGQSDNSMHMTAQLCEGLDEIKLGANGFIVQWIYLQAS